MSEVAGETSAVAVCIAHVALKFEGGGSAAMTVKAGCKSLNQHLHCSRIGTNGHQQGWLEREKNGRFAANLKHIANQKDLNKKAETCVRIRGGLRSHRN